MGSDCQPQNHDEIGFDHLSKIEIPITIDSGESLFSRIKEFLSASSRCCVGFSNNAVEYIPVNVTDAELSMLSSDGDDLLSFSFSTDLSTDSTSLS